MRNSQGRRKRPATNQPAITPNRAVLKSSPLDHKVRMRNCTLARFIAWFFANGGM
jgi:hypothetical protein